MATDGKWWLHDTPECSYDLTAYDPTGISAQNIDITMEEYAALKDHLARMRGLTTSDKPAEEPPSNPLLDRMATQGFTAGAFLQVLMRIDPLGLELLDDLIHGSQSARDGKDLFVCFREGLKEFAEEHGLKSELA